MAKDPEKAVTLHSVTSGGKTIPAYTVVWVMSRDSGSAEIEYRGGRARISERHLAAYPVKGPGLEVLRQLDSCFGLDDSAFEREHIDHERYFEVVRCKAHQSRFLRDTRGTIGMYSRLILLRADDGDAAEAWSKYHAISDAELLLDGRTL